MIAPRLSGGVQKLMKNTLGHILCARPHGDLPAVLSGTHGFKIIWGFRKDINLVTDSAFFGLERRFLPIGTSAAFSPWAMECKEGSNWLSMLDMISQHYG